MRISIFYRNVFEPGGAPVGIRHLANRLAKRHDVALWGHATDDEWPLLDGVQQRSYVGRSELARRLPGWIATDAPEILLIVGFFLPDNIPVVRAARRAGVSTVLHPMAQVWDSALKGKIFTHGCDVRALEKKRINRDGLVARVSNWLNPAAKRAFMHSVGRAMGLGTDAVAVLSDDERTQFQSYFPRPDRDFVTMEWGVDELETMPDDSAHFFRDTLGVSMDRPNLIVWSRLDWHYKGLDRLLNGVAEVKRRQSNVPFRLYLCGPDYREGSVLARQFIAQHGLQDDVFVFLPGDYTPGSKTPLRDADASVLLSRWDGSPRALRESLLFGTPVLVSPETNFAGIVERYGCGDSVRDADDASAVADMLLRTTDAAQLQRWTAATQTASDDSHWDTIAGRLAQDFHHIAERPVARTVAERVGRALASFAPAGVRA